MKAAAAAPAAKRGAESAEVRKPKRGAGSRAVGECGTSAEKVRNLSLPSVPVPPAPQLLKPRPAPDEWWPQPGRRPAVYRKLAPQPAALLKPEPAPALGRGRGRTKREELPAPAPTRRGDDWPADGYFDHQ